MVTTVDQLHQRRRWRRGGAPVEVARIYRPLNVASHGLLVTLLAAWGGIAAFVGPEFGYRPTTASSWQWTTNNWLLHLVPGAVGVAAGLLLLSRAPAAAASRGVHWMAALAAIAAGAWFVLGPAAWPIFESSPAYHFADTARAGFLNQLGANLGPGFLLAVLGGMALKTGITARPAASGTVPVTTPLAADPVSPPAPEVAGPGEV
jgi:hypothetical protein